MHKEKQDRVEAFWLDLQGVTGAAICALFLSMGPLPPIIPCHPPISRGNCIRCEGLFSRCDEQAVLQAMVRGR
jgi:hypothetical protein